MTDTCPDCGHPIEASWHDGDGCPFRPTGRPPWRQQHGLDAFEDGDGSADR